MSVFVFQIEKDVKGFYPVRFLFLLGPALLEVCIVYDHVTGFLLMLSIISSYYFGLILVKPSQLLLNQHKPARMQWP